MIFGSLQMFLGLCLCPPHSNPPLIGVINNCLNITLQSTLCGVAFLVGIYMS